MMGPFESMTSLSEWRELIEDWRNKLERDTLADQRRSHMDALSYDHKIHIAGIATGVISALDSFDRYLKTRIESERAGKTRPLPKELTSGLRNLRRN